VEEYFRITESDSGLVSNWSQRHIAFPAGLGTFSLSDGLITPRGVAMRCGSVVSDLPLPTSRRLYESHLFNCLFYRDGSCGKCIDRCPVGAISEKGHDRKRCQECLFVDQRVLIERSGASGYTGAYAGCGLCQTKVPCEDRIPRSTRSPEAAAQPGT
jgi:epoxyqueuosine reductase